MILVRTLVTGMEAIVLLLLRWQWLVRVLELEFLLSRQPLWIRGLIPGLLRWVLDCDFKIRLQHVVILLELMSSLLKISIIIMILFQLIRIIWLLDLRNSLVRIGRPAVTESESLAFVSLMWWDLPDFRLRFLICVHDSIQFLLF